MDNFVKKLNQSIVAIFLALFVFSANGQELKSTLCSTLTVDAGVNLDVAVPVNIEAQAGAGWAIAFKGHALGELRGQVSTNITTQSGLELTTITCVDTVDLLELYNRRLLTPEQQAQVALYLGGTVRDFDLVSGTFDDEKSRNIGTGLVSAASFAQMQAHRTTSIYDPAATMIDASLDAITGQLSPLNAIDETVGSIKSLVDAMPMDPRLANYIRDVDTVMANQVVSMMNGADVICDALDSTGSSGATEALVSFCNDLTDFASSTEALQDVIQGVLGIVGDVGGQIEETAVIFDGLVDVTEGIDGVLSDGVELMTDVVSDVNSATQEVVDMTSGVKGTVDSLTDSLDDVASVANTTISTVMSVVATPLKVLADLSSGALNDALGALRTVNGLLEDLVGDIKS